MDTKRFLIFIVIFRVVLFVFRSWVQGGRCISKARLEGKVAVITGANTGIGRETAKDLVRRGAEVHVLCRDVERGEVLRRDIKKETGREVLIHQIDLASLETVRECAAALRKKLQKIDILVNNAGVMATPEWRTQEGFELQFGTNHVGHFLLTNELLPLLRKAGNARVVVVSSSAHAMGRIDFEDLNWRTRPYDSMGAYGQSKLANVLFAKELARRETQLGSGVTVYSLHPGIVKTELSRHFKETFGSVLFYLVKLLGPLTKTPESGAQTSICCAVDPALENQTGKYYKDCQEVMNSPEGDNIEDARQLWEVTMDMVRRQ
eukprot:GFUD01009197.1.p1 GENE.GFUD01009197.1~~GFUD01009197.1.p1  ORF type:complete len:320 (+),score=100.99 GFUD01009197.1:106-1065(+)